MDMKVTKFKYITYLLIALVFLSLAEATYASQQPTPVPGDARIKQYIYQPDTVYAFTGHYGYQSRIDLDPNEEILTMTLGDTTRWSINPVGHRLFLKPIDFDATTNMTIITSKRIYYFELYAEEAEGIDDQNIVFAARFIYGSDPSSSADSDSFMSLNYEEESQIPNKKKQADQLNFNYSVTGSRYISPLEVFDNGEFTYFRFKDINADLPAIFQVMPDGNEALINFRVAEGYVIVEMATSQFTLRHGSMAACVFNDSMPMEKTNVKKDDKNRTSFFGIF